MCRGGQAGGFYVTRVGWSLLCEEGMPQCGGRHVALPLGSHYYSWVSHWYNRAPLVSVGDRSWLCRWEMKTSAWVNVLVKCGVSTISREVVQYLRVSSSQVFPWVCNLVARDYSCEASSTRALNILSFCFAECVRCSITHVLVAKSFRAIHWCDSVKCSLFARLYTVLHQFVT
jgi:hypothetical protein